MVLLDEDPGLSERLTDYQKALIAYQSRRFLGAMSAEQFRTGLASIKTTADKIQDFWNRYGGPISAGGILRSEMRRHLEGVVLNAEETSAFAAALLYHEALSSLPTTSRGEHNL
jgi:hypothetical protein